MSTSICWKPTYYGLVSLPGGVKDTHLLNTTETREMSLATKLQKDLA